MSEIRVNKVVNSTGDNDSGLDMTNNDEVLIKTANTTALTINASQEVLIGSNIAKASGKETIWIPAGAMYPNTTAGCSALTQVELSNGPELKVLDFDASSDEFAQFTVSFPKSWDEGTVTFQAFWTVTGTDTGTVSWALTGRGFADNAEINHADGFPTAVVATAKAFSGTTDDMTISAESGTLAILDRAVDTTTFFEISRFTSVDTQTGDARLIGIKLFFTTNAKNDS